ncbi:MAG: hypothetical protein Q4Q58_06210 [Thermoplasmata archaeon]|nr:hypothetical protein [Thermoplasmata archaeon]
MNPLPGLGVTVATERIIASINSSGCFAADLAIAMERYLNQDWGDIDEDDARMNDESVESCGRGSKATDILASYEVDGQEVWIHTAWDRSVTTILFPDEY